jgi:hypothetical protein
LPCETALWLFHEVGRRRKLKGWARTWMSHHQIPRLDGNQAERCDGNLPFASRLMALLSTTGHWAGQAFVEGEIPFSGGLHKQQLRQRC